MTTLRYLPVLTLTLAAALASGAASAAERFDLGLRGILMVANGEPANDIPGFGVFGRYRLSSRWALGFAVDQTEYDFEEPAKVLGLTQAAGIEPVDVLAEATTTSLWLERTFARPRSEWFLGVGLGASSVDVPDAAGPLQGTGRFDIHTEVDTEIVVSLLAGFRRSLGSRWFVRGQLRADQHLAQWNLTDRASGRTGTIDDYLAYGADIGLGITF